MDAPSLSDPSTVARSEAQAASEAGEARLQPDFVNLAAYKFVALPDCALWREPIRRRCVELDLKGTILLAAEGINLFLAGSERAAAEFLDWLRSDARFAGAFADLEAKESRSMRRPFRRMLVKLKKEIITMRHPTIRPGARRAPAIAPERLRQWLDRGCDDSGREVVLLDTRNAFEVELGSFDGAHEFKLRSFGEFPRAMRAAAHGLRDKTVVTFCTGGIRCEKAALYLHEIGLPNVLQLDGGILKYFEEVGGAHWRGDCFVFDDRVALDPGLRETATRQCYACRGVVGPGQQSDPRYVAGESCPRCYSQRREAASESGAAAP